MVLRTWFQFDSAICVPKGKKRAKSASMVKIQPILMAFSIHLEPNKVCAPNVKAWFELGKICYGMYRLAVRSCVMQAASCKRKTHLQFTTGNEPAGSGASAHGENGNISARQQDARFCSTAHGLVLRARRSPLGSWSASARNRCTCVRCLVWWTNPACAAPALHRQNSKRCPPPCATRPARRSRSRLPVRIA